MKNVSTYKNPEYVYMDQMATRILISDDHSSKFHFQISCNKTLLGELFRYVWKINTLSHFPRLVPK